MNKELTPKEYDKLSLGKSYFWKPVYKKYKIVKEKDYCEECGGFTGYSSKNIGVGKPIKYIPEDPITAITQRSFEKALIDGSILMENSLMSFINKESKNKQKV